MIPLPIGLVTSPSKEAPEKNPEKWGKVQQLTVVQAFLTADIPVSLFIAHKHVGSSPGKTSMLPPTVQISK